MPKIIIPQADNGQALQKPATSGADVYSGQAKFGDISRQAAQDQAQASSSIGSMTSSYGMSVGQQGINLQQQGVATMNKGIQMMHESQDALDDYNFNRVYAEASVEYNQAVADRLAHPTDEKGNPNFHTLQQDIEKIGNDTASKYGQLITSPGVAVRFQKEMASMRLNNGLKAISESRKQQVDFAAASLTDVLRANSLNSVADSGANRDFYFSSSIKAIDNALKNGYIDAGTADKLKEEARSATYYTPLQLENAKDPNAIANKLKNSSSTDLRLNSVEMQTLGIANIKSLQSQHEQLKKQEADNAAKIKAQQTIANSWYDVGITDGKVTRSDLDKAVESGQIAPGMYAGLIKRLNSSLNKSATGAQLTANINNDIEKGNVLGGTYTTSQLNDWYKQLVATQQQSNGGKPLDLAQEAQLLGSVKATIPDFNKKLSATLGSGSVEQTTKAAQAYSYLLEKNADSLSINAKDAAAAGYISRQIAVGAKPEEAVLNARKFILNVTEDDYKQRLKSWSAEPDIHNDTSFMRHISKTMTDITSNDVFGKDPKMSDTLTFFAKSLLKDNYMVTGNMGLAEDATKDQLKRLVSTSEINPTSNTAFSHGLSMVLPPEKAYPNVPVDSLKSSFALDKQKYLASGESPDSIYLVSDTVTLMHQKLNDKNPTSYAIMKTDANGISHPVLGDNGVPERWFFDEKQYRTDIQNSQLEQLKKAREAAAPVIKPEAQQMSKAISAKGPEDLIHIASAYYGLDENKDRAVLAQAMYKSTGQRIDPSRTPWCAAFANAVLAQTNRPGTNSLTASSFLNYGKPTTTPTQGDVVVTQPLSNGATGHVGFFAGYEYVSGDRHVRILSGNSNNRVGITSVPERLVRGYRIPPDAADIKAESKTTAAFDPRTYMTTRGIRNNNPGNLRLTNEMWPGETQGSDKSFKSFTTPEDGIRGIYTSLSKKSDRGLNTIQSIIESYAPPSENNTQSYISSVAKQTGIDPTTKLNLKDKNVAAKIIQAIITHENGSDPYGLPKILASLK